MAFKSRSTFVGHCKNMHNFDDGGEPDTPLPLHKVSFSLYSIKLICILLIEMVRDTSIQIEESAFYIKSVC